MKNVSNVDFSKHQLKITKHERVAIYEFKKPDTIVHGITFINAMGVLTVTGDFGNWVFCREFHPKPDSSVSRGYWDEKLEILSVQESHQYDEQETRNLLKQFVDEFKGWYDREMNEDEAEWIDSLLYNSGDKLDYKIAAYRDTPNTIGYEDVPYGEVRHFWLDVIYDAFNEICERMKEENVLQKQYETQ